MYENIQDAHEIKRRLSERGQEVDENVICELLESFVPEDGVDRIEQVINMITDNQDSNTESSDEAGPSNASLEYKINKTPKTDVQNFSFEYNDIDVPSSDTDDDRDFYYQSSWDDISIVDTVTRSSPSHSLLELCNVTSLSNQVTPIVDQTAISNNNNNNNNQDAAEIEFLEENNNDPNNNLDSAQMLEEMQNNSTNVVHERNRLLTSPKPGCSKDCDDSSTKAEEENFEEQRKDTVYAVAPIKDCYKNSEETFDNQTLRDRVESSTLVDRIEKLRKDAKQIHALLPKFEYCLIYKTLLNNRFAKNRVELTLWDLLSEERPVIEYTSEPESSDKISCTERTKRSDDSPENTPTDVKTTSVKTIEHTCPESEAKVDHVNTECKNLISVISNEIRKLKRCIMEEPVVIELNNDTAQKSPPKKAKMSEDISNSNTNTCNVHGHSQEPGPSKLSETSLTNEKEPQSTKVSVTLPKTESLNVYLLPTASLSPLSLSSSSSSCSNVLRPARFTLNTSTISSTPSFTSHPTTILSPPKFTYSSRNLPQVCNVNKYNPGISPEWINQASQTIFKTKKLLVKTRNDKSLNASQNKQKASGLNVAQSCPRFKRSCTTNGSRNIGTTWQVIDISDVQNTSAGINPGTSIQTSTGASTDAVGNIRINPGLGTASGIHGENTSSKSATRVVNLGISHALLNKTPFSAKTEEARLTKNADVCVISVMPIPLAHSSKSIREAENDQQTLRVARQTITPQLEKKKRKKLHHTESDADSTIPTMNTAEQSNANEDERNTNDEDANQQKDDTGEARGEETNKQANAILNNAQGTSKTMQTATMNNQTMNNNNTIVLNEKARKLYYKLIPMFPCMNLDYIKRVCQTSVKDNEQLLDEVLLQNIAEQLLDFNPEQLEKPFVIKEPEPEPLPAKNTYDVNEQYADLLGIFPEADPVYLREVAEEMYNDPEKIKEFVQSKLEKPDYPTREQYLAKKKITEQQKRYTTDFQVEQFLEIFPDPFSHFENETRQCQFHPHAVDFLKQYFSKIRVNTLLKLYSQNMHNLSLTVKNLETLSPDMKSKRHSYSNKILLTENIPLLQECAFIQHKTELGKHLNGLKEKEEKEFNELKAKNELLECQCCYDNECMPSKCSTCEDGHIFCNSCIARSTDVVLADGKTQVDCLTNCGCGFPLSVLQRILSPTKFSILLKKRQEAEVMAAGLEGLVSCPFCHFASIPPSEDKIFKCLNPDCMKESCRLCKEINHIPLKCNEAKSDAARLYLEEKMTEALVRKCYCCGKMFFKEEGCNKMTCVCGAQMCYLCDQPVINYNHFRGQGASPSNSNLCPLWSDDLRMNAESVIKVCHETMKQIKEKNPKVDINVDALLPKLPPKRRGPHEDIAHINAIPIRANIIPRHLQ